jgi:hypothetical protein
VVLITLSPLSGRYSICIRVVDYSGYPLPNIPVTLSVDRNLSSFSGILAKSSSVETRTDSEGRISVRAGRGQKIYCSINQLYKRLSPYRCASISIESYKGKFYFQYSWSNVLFDPATNKHSHRDVQPDLPKELKIFLPIDNGQDGNLYINENKGFFTEYCGKRLKVREVQDQVYHKRRGFWCGSC